ncbi:lambda-exonuclease family protein [Halomonas elongata]|uniref:lambda-exonuclease family protein n=1 Tax=Halomonas elongata TaxID=2746 RepID=UPI00186B8284|nr:YqaJ viral recombinase family protein [Halomonas elongata]MBW5801149.1 YqaJ viral recombinase family protein [Halomonas elongata]
MIIHNVRQGTEEWHQLRANHFTASEAPAMAGVSKYTSRADLLKQKYTGVAEEVTAAQQHLFDKGHAAEAAARPIAEEIVDEELYPVVATSEEHSHLLASLDGCTMLEDVIFEHKLWNENLAAAVQENDLPEHYKVQMDQQLLVSGAERCLFMCSDGSREKCAWCWYEPDQKRFDALLAGWEQFRADLEAYQPTEQKVTPQGEAPEALPALKIDLTGAVQASNLPDFKARALAMIEGIKTELATDKDFADAESTVKFLQKGEKQLKDSKQAALQQTASIAELFDTIDELTETMRQKRLKLEKLVKAEKDNRRLEIQRSAEQAYDTHIGSIEKELEAACNWPIRFQAPDAGIAAAMKGKRTMSSLQDAADTAVANAKIKADEAARQIRGSIDVLKQETEGFESLFADAGQLVCDKAPDDLRNLARSRIAEHKEAEAKRQEVERERIRREEEAKAKAEAANKEAIDKAIAAGKDEPQQEESAPEKRAPIDTSRITQAAGSFQRGSQVAKPETVEISRKEYDALLAARAKLDALEAAGVDNWSGYGDAMAALEAA